MTTVTIPSVELVKVGIWAASQGDGTVTAEDIAAMAAAYRNPMADKIPLKIGHTDPRFQDARGNVPADHDGNPAYGWVENVRASSDGQTLLGDFVGVPPKLAEAMPSALRNRSVEFMPGKRLGGKVYRAVLTAVALLGAAAPAVKGLADVLALYSQGSTVAMSQRPAADVSLADWAARRVVGGRSHTTMGVPISALSQADHDESFRRAMNTFFPKPL